MLSLSVLNREMHHICACILTRQPHNWCVCPVQAIEFMVVDALVEADEALGISSRIWKPEEV